MKFVTTAMAAAGALAAAGVVGAGVAGADAGDAAPATHPIGTQAKVVNGGVVQGWTVSNLKPSSDAIPYQPRGTLWEATATDEALQGTAIPIVANLGARSASGQTYMALFTVATPQGVNPSNIPQGQKTSGKVYFDVTGDAPNSAVYQDSGKDVAVWTPAPAPAATGGSSQSSAPAATSPKTAAAPAAATPKAGQTTPATGQSATDTTAAATEGSQGTPLASGSQGTPLPAEESTAAAATSAGTPEATAPEAPASPAGPNEPVPAGSSGTPLPAEAPATPGAPGTEGAPAQVPATPQEPGSIAKPPVPAGNQGTPLPAAPAGSAPAASGASNVTGSR